MLTDVNGSKDNARKIRARLGACRTDLFTREPCLEMELYGVLAAAASEAANASSAEPPSSMRRTAEP